MKETNNKRLLTVAKYILGVTVSVREKFGFDPVKMLDFVKNDANYEEAVKLGIRALDPIKEDAKKQAAAAAAAAAAVKKV